MSKSERVITINYGLSGGKLDATEHVERFKDMEKYNAVLRNGKTVYYRQPGSKSARD